MRIISGSAKSRKLFTPPDHEKEIRPTADRTREALFSIIGEKITDAQVLDLFAGTGALGCESLSRGAQFVLFIDNSKLALNLIKKNISIIPDGLNRSSIIKQDLRRGLNFDHFSFTKMDKVDLVFADPPYQKGFSEKILHCLDNSTVLAENVLVIIEEKKDVDLAISLNNLIFKNSRCYGDARLSFFGLKTDY